MSTDTPTPTPTPTPEALLAARVAEWCAVAGIVPAELAAVHAELSALPFVIPGVQFRCGFTLESAAMRRDYWHTWEGIRPPASKLVMYLEVCSGALSYPEHTGYRTYEIEGRGSSYVPGGRIIRAALRSYAAELEKAADAAVAVRLRDPGRKARRDQEVINARATAEGVRAIAARHGVHALCTGLRGIALPPSAE